MTVGANAGVDALLLVSEPNDGAVADRANVLAVFTNPPLEAAVVAPNVNPPAIVWFPAPNVNPDFVVAAGLEIAELVAPNCTDGTELVPALN